MKASVSLRTELWKKHQVAVMLNICVRVVERLVSMGKLVKVTTVVGGVRITDSSLREYLKEIGCDQACCEAKA